MSAEQTPRGMRHNIVFVGKRNVGKSSLINAVVGQDISIVSEIAGTTTDTVQKPYELLPLGPVTFIDTAGYDDNTALGTLRIAATNKALYKADVAVLVFDKRGLADIDKKFLDKLKKMKLPVLAVFNKADEAKIKPEDIEFLQDNKIKFLDVSALEGLNINTLKETMASLAAAEIRNDKTLLDGIVKQQQTVVLVAPIDSSAPKGRLILPQVQVLREILDEKACAMVCQPEELEQTLLSLKKNPDLVITDSQAVAQVHRIVPQSIPLTTFSILFARQKGDLKILVDGAEIIDNLADNDKILIAEACSHHAQDDDIAKVKIPKLLQKYSNKTLNFDFCSGCDFPKDLNKYRLVIHCGGCMISRTEMCHRLNECCGHGVGVTNYGVAISKTQGILQRVIKPFGL